ncbi:hypothetical protein ARMGADRAFT_1164847 [Armillaria gallica]|uniref:Uncharacterized protein n=1 Tax=Armillaria gallica TaxID=47427 RepID=A0A2H3DT52_ARMGA|nr:hypothetical protein ARMGADRAFT_1164847 [Armillaria gallica]
MGLKNCIYTSRIGVGRSNARNHPYLGYAVSASPREPPPGSLSRLTTSLPCLSFFLGLYLPAWSQPEPLSLSLNHQSNVSFAPTRTLWTSVYTLTTSSSWTLRTC